MSMKGGNTAVNVTDHAVQRYQERIANLSAQEVRATLDTAFIRKAIAFGAAFIRLPSGHRLTISRNGTVVTVLPKKHPSQRMAAR